MRYVRQTTRQQIVHPNHFIALLDKPITEMRA